MRVHHPHPLSALSITPL